MRRRLDLGALEGKGVRIRFSGTGFGRVSGLNEHGFGVTGSLGSLMSRVEVAGLPYSIVPRILLDRCRSVPEALDVLEELPIASYSSNILADPSGEAALVEIACCDRAVRRLAPGKAPLLS